MPALLQLLFSKAGVAGVIALAILSLFGCQEVRLKMAQAGEARARTEVADAGRRLDACRSDVDRQNDAVNALKAESDARLAQSAKAAQAVRAVAESYRRAGQRVLTARKGDLDSCAAADRLILEHVR